MRLLSLESRHLKRTCPFVQVQEPAIGEGNTTGSLLQCALCACLPQCVRMHLKKVPTSPNAVSFTS